MSIPRKLKPCKTCTDPRYLFSHGNCLECYNRLKLVSKPTCTHVTLKQTSQKIAKPFRVIKSVSDKRKKLDAIYNIAATQFKKDNPYCMARLDVCTDRTSDIHHKKGRGEYLLDVTTWLATCRECHHRIELNPAHAKELGLSENRLDK